MNEQLAQTLAKQASDYYWTLEDGERNARAFENKLIELTVRECADYGDNGAADILRHFGIES